MEQFDNEFLEHDGECPLTYTLGIIGGKWKINILYHIYMNKNIRYGQLKRLLRGITHKVFSSQLKELIAAGLVLRVEYLGVPSHVEYSLTKKGESVLPIFKAMYEWGKENIE